MIYPKINTIFERNPVNNYKSIILDKYSSPIFSYLKDNDWLWTEKIDGTNIRIQYNKNSREVICQGRTDKSQSNPTLITNLYKHFSVELFEEIFGTENDVCLYGEGVGPKVHNDSEKYAEIPQIILFDILVGGWWLKFDAVSDIALKLGIKSVPIVTIGNFQKAVEKCLEGYKSSFGDFIAEGLVGTPLVQLFDNKGNRIITKLKYRDFNEFRQKMI